MQTCLYNPIMLIDTAKPGAFTRLVLYGAHSPNIFNSKPVLDLTPLSRSPKSQFQTNQRARTLSPNALTLLARAQKWYQNSSKSNHFEYTAVLMFLNKNDLAFLNQRACQWVRCGPATPDQLTVSVFHFLPFQCSKGKLLNFLIVAVFCLPLSRPF